MCKSVLFYNVYLSPVTHFVCDCESLNKVIKEGNSTRIIWGKCFKTDFV